MIHVRLVLALVAVFVSVWFLIGLRAAYREKECKAAVVDCLRNDGDPGICDWITEVCDNY